MNPVSRLLMVLFGEKEAGLEKQYLLTGVSYAEIYASRYISQLLSLAIVYMTLPTLISLLNKNADLGLMLIPQALAVLALPLNVIFLFSIYKNLNARKTVRNINLILQVTTFTLPVGACFLGVTGGPGGVLVSFVIEGICCLHPLNTVAFIWIKQAFRGWYAINSPYSTSTDLLSINSCLLEIIGLSVNLVVLPLLIYKRETW